MRVTIGIVFLFKKIFNWSKIHIKLTILPIFKCAYSVTGDFSFPISWSTTSEGSLCFWKPPTQCTGGKSRGPKINRHKYKSSFCNFGQRDLKNLGVSIYIKRVGWESGKVTGNAAGRKRFGTYSRDGILSFHTCKMDNSGIFLRTLYQDQIT